MTLGDELWRQLTGGTGKAPKGKPEPVTVDQARDILKELGVSQRYLATETGIPRSTIGAWFRGEIARPKQPERLRTVLDKIDLGLSRAWVKSLPADPWTNGKIVLNGTRSEDGTRRRIQLGPRFLERDAPKKLRDAFLMGATRDQLARKLIEMTTDPIYKRLLATAQYPGVTLPGSRRGDDDEGDWVDGEAYGFVL